MPHSLDASAYYHVVDDMSSARQDALFKPYHPTNHFNTFLDFAQPDGARAFDAGSSHCSKLDPSSTSSRSHSACKTDMRRNLYVLGIPVDLVQEDFMRIFTPYGVVEHAVIMATLDQFNRRRGFIVMATNEQANAAMRALSGVPMKGFQLHISFAVVQRSEGFLDGGDRAPRRRRATGPSMHPASSPLSSPPSLSSPQFGASPLAGPLNSTIIALNLCPVALPRATDVHALFSRFGSVRAVRLASGNPGTAVVAFDTYDDAAAALELLDGMPLGAFVVRLMSAEL